MSKKQKAREALRQSAWHFRRKVEIGMPTSLTQAGRKKRRGLAIQPGSLADDKARIAAGDILIDELVAHYVRTKNIGLRHFLITFCCDAGLLPEGTTEFDNLSALRLSAYKALSDLGLSGIGVLEISPLRATKRNLPMLVAHLHVVGWTSDTSFKPKKAAKALSGKARFQNRLGAPGVTIRSRKASARTFKDKDGEICDHLFSEPHLDQTKASMAWLGYYLFKAPAYVMQLCPKKADPNQFVMRSNTTNYSPRQALELERLLNTIPIVDAVFSVDKGTDVGRAWRASFRRKLKKLYGPSTEERFRKKRSKTKVRKRRANLEARLRKVSRPVFGPTRRDVMDLIHP